jgi:hypothetical protein
VERSGGGVGGGAPGATGPERPGRIRAPGFTFVRYRPKNLLPARINHDNSRLYETEDRMDVNGIDETDVEAAEARYGWPGTAIRGTPPGGRKTRPVRSQWVSCDLAGRTRRFGPGRKEREFSPTSRVWRRKTYCSPETAWREWSRTGMPGRLVWCAPAPSRRPCGTGHRAADGEPDR